MDAVKLQQTAVDAPPQLAPVVPEVADIVTFEADGAVVHSTLPNVTSIPRSLFNTNNDDLEHSIKSFLSRPYKIASGDWDIANVRNHVLWSGVFPDLLLTHPLISDKIRGFVGFKATTFVRIQVNAQRMQAGRLLLSYVPMPTQMGLADPDRAAYYSNNILPKTCVPHVDLDASSTSDVTLSAPYVSPTQYHSLVTHKPSFARFDLTVYSPLRSVGLSTAEFSVWAHFEDIELFWPTDPDSFITVAGLVYQMGTPQEQERASKGKGPVESVATVVFDISSALSNVPLLSSVAKPVSWAAAAATQIAKFFGWSKPTDAAPPMSVTNNPYQGFCHSDGIDRSAKLALFSDNSVQALPGFAGSDRDELAISAIAARYAFATSFEWESTTPTDTQIFRVTNSPRTASLVAENATARQFGPLGYVSSMFAYWRGSIRYTFKFVKTEFHSGRVLICFAPGVSDVTAVGSDYCYKTVVDLKLTDTVEFIVPFASAASWEESTHSTGIVAMFVLNKLVAPDNVPSSIQVILETSAGDDFAVAVPNIAVAPTYDIEYQMGSSFVPLEHAKYTIGEQCFSFRSLLKRFTRILDGSGDGLTLTPATYVFGSQPDWYTYLAPMFLLARGSFRIKVLSESSSHLAARLIPERSTLLDILPPATYGVLYARYGPDARAICYPSLTGLLEIELPQYNQYHSFLPASYHATAGSSYESTQHAVVYGECKDVYRAVGDDFDMGFFLFPPALSTTHA